MKIAIDLGLSFLLCDRNVGAGSPDDLGKLFRPDPGLSKAEQTKAWEKECGGRWRLPSLQEIQEIQERCIIQSATRHDKHGYVIIGPNKKRVFLPDRIYLLGQGPCVMGFRPDESLTKIFVPFANTSFEHYPNIAYSDREGIPIRPVCSGEPSGWDKTARFFEYSSADDEIKLTKYSRRYFPDLAPEYENSPAETNRKKQEESRRREASLKSEAPKDKYDTGSVVDRSRSEMELINGLDAFVTLQNGRLYQIKKQGNAFAFHRLSNCYFNFSFYSGGLSFEEALKSIEENDFAWAYMFYERYKRLPDSNS